MKRPSRLLVAPLLAALTAFAAEAQISLPALSEPAEDERDTEADLNRLMRQTRQAILRADFPEAERLAQRAHSLAQRLFPPDHPSLIEIANNLGAAYLVVGRYVEAEPLLLGGLRLREERLGESHRDTLAAIDALALLYMHLGRYAEAETFGRRALAAAERIFGRRHDRTFLSALNLANTYRTKGQYADAEPLYRRAIDGYERTSGRDHQLTLGAVEGLAALYSLEGRYDESEGLYLRVTRGYERGFGADHHYTVSAMSNLSTLYIFQGRLPEAEQIQANVLAARERSLGENSPDTLDAVHNLAITLLLQRRHAEAQVLFERVLRGRERALGANHPKTLGTLHNLGEAHQGQGRNREAERLYLRAYQTSLRVYGDTHPPTIIMAAGNARFYLRTGLRGGSIAAFARQAVQGIETRRITGAGGFTLSDSDGTQIGSEIYFTLLADALWIDAQAARGRRRPPLPAAEAFSALQNAGAGTTDRAVVRMAVRRMADASGIGLGALVRERETLADQAAATTRSYSNFLAQPEAETSRQRQLRSQAARIGERIDEVDARLRRDFPQYFSLIRPEPLDVAASQALLAPDEAFLLVVPSEFGTHVIAVSRTGIAWSRSAWTKSQVDDAVRRLLWDVGANVNVSAAQSAIWEREGGPGFSYDRRTAHALYQQVVAPAEPILRGKRHVFIAASGSLSSLPFGILVTQPPQGPDGDPTALRTTRWFADTHALVQIPSLQSLQFLRRFSPDRPRSNGPSNFIGFGDPVLQGQAVQRGRGRMPGAGLTAASTVSAHNRARNGAGLADVTQLRRLNRLPGTATELQSIRQALNAPADSLFLGAQATERRFRALDLSRTDILVLATHGLIAGELRGTVEPGLVLTPPNRGNEEDDGFLTASEVSALRLDADWVILSACNTAAGDGSQGAPGLSGLARAFFYAGARNLLASHWPVRDDVAASLTVRTIALLRDTPRLSRAEALQRAMREVRDDASHDGPNDTWAHPSVWAPFSLIGDGAR